MEILKQKIKLLGEKKMNNRLINILIDFAFKQVFAGNGESSEIILKDFLNSILQLKDDDRIKEIVQLNPFNEREYIKDKQSIMDIKIKTEKDEYIDIEVQINDVDDYNYSDNDITLSDDEGVVSDG